MRNQPFDRVVAQGVDAQLLRRRRGVVCPIGLEAEPARLRDGVERTRPFFVAVLDADLVVVREHAGEVGAAQVGRQQVGDH